MALVVVEQRFDRPVSAEALARALKEGAWCREIHGVRHVETLLDQDGRAMLCVFDAPDLEAVRAVARRMGYRYERMWSATRHGSPDRVPAR